MTTTNANKMNATTTTNATVALPARRRSHEERQAFLEEYRRGVEERRQERELRKLEKLAAREGKTPHMAKVERAAAMLPELSPEAEQFFTDAINGLTPAELTAFAAHIEFHNRKSAIGSAKEASLKVGDKVKIAGGQARYLGLTGTVDEVRNVRCFVALDADPTRRVYLYVSDVEHIQADESEPVAEAV